LLIIVSCIFGWALSFLPKPRTGAIILFTVQLTGLLVSFYFGGYKNYPIQIIISGTIANILILVSLGFAIVVFKDFKSKYQSVN
jgi:hypothetical protein